MPSSATTSSSALVTPTKPTRTATVAGSGARAASNATGTSGTGEGSQLGEFGPDLGAGSVAFGRLLGTDGGGQEGAAFLDNRGCTAVLALGSAEDGLGLLGRAVVPGQDRAADRGIMGGTGSEDGGAGLLGRGL